MSEPARRKPGRPPLDESSPRPSEDVSLTLSAKDYDRAYQIARRNRESLQDTIRRSLKRLLEIERS